MRGQFNRRIPRSFAQDIHLCETGLINIKLNCLHVKLLFPNGVPFKRKSKIERSGNEIILKRQPHLVKHNQRETLKII